MPTRARALVAALAAIAAGSLAVAACAPAPPPASLSDPREIVAAAVAHLRAARTVHLDAGVTGTLAIGSLIGMPAAPQATGGGLGLTGTHVEGDLDLAAQRAALRFQVPALLGLEGEIRQLGTDTYLESSLTGRGWYRLGGAGLPAVLDRPVEWVSAVATWIERPATVPVRLDDQACRSGTCYVVRVTPGAGEVEALASAAAELASGFTVTTVTLELRIDRSSVVLSEVALDVDLGAGGALSVAATFSGWDVAVDVEPPPASDIVDGPLLP